MAEFLVLSKVILTVVDAIVVGLLVVDEARTFGETEKMLCI